MRALVLREWTRFENVRIEEDWPTPTVQPGTVKIRTQSVGMNFALSLRVEGKYQVKPPLPHVPGIDLCGIVTELGAGVTRFAVGDRVVAFVDHGAFAEECIALEHRTFRLPDGIPFVQAVTFPSSWMTTYIALVWPQWGNLQFGETMLVNGAAGAVGIAALDIGKIMGATVIATCGSARKVEVCRAHGADHVINYREEDFVARVREVTDGVGADLIYDPVGGDVTLRSLRCVAPEGRIIPIGFASGKVPDIPANILLMKHAKVLAMNAGYYNGQWGVDPARHRDMGKVFEPQLRHTMDQLFRWTMQGRMTPEISHVFTFDQVHEAMETVLGRESIGKVAVVFDEEARRLAAVGPRWGGTISDPDRRNHDAFRTMNLGQLSLNALDAGQARRIVADWLGRFETALNSRDAALLGDLFHQDCNWRDILAFTWNLTPVEGRTNVAARLAAEQEHVGAHGFHLPPGRKPPARVKRLEVDSIEAIIGFSTAHGRGAGLVRLSAAHDGRGEMKAWLLSTTLEALDGYEEKIGDNRPTGAAYSRNFGGDNWADQRRKAIAYEDSEPAVLVVGGAQAGLSIAARLNQLGVDTLVVERLPRIGDSWRKRYHSLALHNSIHLNHLPYMDFPPTWPRYIPKDMLANWFELYADVMEVNCWTDTEFVAASWDENSKTWTARLKKGDGTERTVRPRHIVLANGVSSYPMIPDLPGLKDFKGDVIHSEGFDNGEPWRGKNALIIGTGSSANDIALDLHSHGVHTTLIQRGSSTVVSIDPSARLNEAIWDEGGPLEDCDLIVASATPPLVVKAYQIATKRMMELDKPLIEGLKKIGFKYDIGEDATGHQMKYLRRGGGYNLDAGSSALLIAGELGLLQYDKIERFAAEGALLRDGTTVPADLIVLGTGYYPQMELVRRAFGEDTVRRIGPVWGIGPDGELNNMYKRTSQEGLWFIAGSLAQCRIYSKYLAIQIKAMELGKLGPLNNNRPATRSST